MFLCPPCKQKTRSKCSGFFIGIKNRRSVYAQSGDVAGRFLLRRADLVVRVNR